MNMVYNYSFMPDIFSFITQEFTFISKNIAFIHNKRIIKDENNISFSQ